MVTELQLSRRRKQLKEELAAVKNPEPQSLWDRVKSLFRYSLTIFMARLTMFGGLVTGMVGSMDLSPLATFDWTTDFNRKQLIGLAAGIIIGGLVFEISRRRSLT